MARDRGAESWDERYAGTHHLWSTGPNEELARVLGPLPPGRAVDLGAGEGRHALWLAGRGWEVTAVDFSRVGVEKGRTHAAEAGVEVAWVVADVRTWDPEPGQAYDLVLVAYLHLEADVLSRAAGWLAPGGRLVVLGHALRNLTDGVGGPRDPSILHTAESLRDKAVRAGLEVERCEEVVRSTPEGDSVDVVLSARRAR